MNKQELERMLEEVGKQADYYDVRACMGEGPLGERIFFDINSVGLIGSAVGADTVILEITKSPIKERRI